jgi:uncharacterized protein YhaN
MRLARLDLALFGHFTGSRIDFGAADPARSDFHIIYGPNEAGKTTTMEAYLRLLYGFRPSEPYAFKHPRASLQVGGALEIGGALHEVTRLPKRENNLLDGAGRPLPETLLQGALGGFSMADYRNLLCLDDATIEAGGEEIIESKSDMGRLLFSASAGVSDLSQILDAVQKNTDDLYKKNTRNSEYAQAKRALDEAQQQIRTLDVSAPDYARMRAALDLAIAEEASALETKQALTLQRVHCEAVTRALPIAQRLHRAGARLAPIAHYPRRLDITPERLVDLALERTKYVAAQGQARAEVEALPAQLKSAAPDQALLELEPALAALATLKSRALTAQIDLPKRAREAEAEAAAMTRILQDLGLEGKIAPEDFVVSAIDLAALEELNGAQRAAEAARAAAVTEARAAADAVQVTQEALDLAEAAAVIGPEAGQIMERFDAAAVASDLRAAKREIDRSMGAFRAAVAVLRREAFDVSMPPEDLPPAPATSARGEAAARVSAAAEIKLAAAQEAAAKTELELRRAEAALEARSARSEIGHSAQAEETRATRDTLWRLHLTDLSPSSAGRFETALHLDDAKQAARAAHAEQIAQYHQALEALNGARVDHDGALRALERAEGEYAVAAEELQDLKRLCGMDGQALAQDVTDWLRHYEAAIEARDLVALSEQQAGPATARAARLRQALVEALRAELGTELNTELDTGSGDVLEALLTIATRLEAERLEQQRAVALAGEKLEHAKSEHKRRMRDVERAEAEIQSAAERADAKMQMLWPDLPSLRDLGPVIAAQRTLRERETAREGYARQARGMAQDMAEFSERMQKLAAHLGEVAEADPLAQFDAIDRRVTAAVQDAKATSELAARLEAARSALEAASGAIARLDAQVTELAAGFDPAIDTQDLDALRTAVGVAQTAIEARDEIAQAEQDLLTELSAESRAKAEVRLAGVSLDAVTAQLADLQIETERAEDRARAAIEARTRAELALASVGGASDVAEARAAKGIAEAQMQDALVRYLKGQFGHMLADRAIRRFRDTHRGTMMEDAEEVFRALTGGAYRALRAQPGLKADTLVAIQSSDGAAKEAASLSKGTRFQLYLALRAAAYSQIVAQGVVLPFFCDDIFETFDEERTRAACLVMEQIGHKGQAIYLTHHAHVVELAQSVCSSVTVHHLEEIKRAAEG